MNFRVRLSNNAVVRATFDPEDTEAFIENRQVITASTFEDSGPEIHKSWKVKMRSNGSQAGHEPRAISGGLGTLIRDDNAEFVIGIETHEYKDIASGNELHFGTSNQDIIDFLGTPPKVRQRP